LPTPFLINCVIFHRDGPSELLFCSWSLWMDPAQRGRSSLGDDCRSFRYYGGFL